MSLLAEHQKILKARIREEVKRIQDDTPKIQAYEMIRQFKEYVNKAPFKERLWILWRVLLAKL